MATHGTKGKCCNLLTCIRCQDANTDQQDHHILIILATQFSVDLTASETMFLWTVGRTTATTKFR